MKIQTTGVDICQSKLRSLPKNVGPLDGSLIQNDILSVPHDAAGLSSSISAISAFEMVLQVVHPKHD